MTSLARLGAAGVVGVVGFGALRCVPVRQVWWVSVLCVVVTQGEAGKLRSGWQGTVWRGKAGRVRQVPVGIGSLRLGAAGMALLGVEGASRYGRCVQARQGLIGSGGAGALWQC